MIEENSGDTFTLTVSEMVKAAFAVQPKGALPSGTRCFKSYLKAYNNITGNPSKSTKAPNEESAK